MSQSLHIHEYERSLSEDSSVETQTAPSINLIKAHVKNYLRLKYKIINYFKLYFEHFVDFWMLPADNSWPLIPLSVCLSHLQSLEKQVFRQLVVNVIEMKVNKNRLH
jgi:hypothetical protein